MVSTLKLTKIQIPNSDSDVLSFNSSTGIMTFHKDIKGEGTATTNLQQGLAKVWVNYTHTTTTAIRDSLNMSSITDLDTGSSTLTFANNMNNDDFAQSNGIGDFGTQFNNGTALGQDGNSSKTTALTRLHVAGQSVNTPYDHHEANVIVHGDLA